MALMMIGINTIINTVNIRDKPIAKVKSFFLAPEAAAAAIAADTPHTEVAVAITITIGLDTIFKNLVPKIHMKIIGVTNQAIARP